MEIVTGALPRLLPKLGELLASEYNLQKEVKGGIRFLQAELESMKGALEDISRVPDEEQLPKQDKIWARNVRELSYDIEDSIDKFMVRCKGGKLAKQHGFNKVINKMLDWLMQPKIRHKIATEVRVIKSHVIEVHERRRRYDVDHSVDRSITAVVDPRIFAHYTKVAELVGIDEPRDELIKTMIEGSEAPIRKGKIVSIVGFGGLGKTTLANTVYDRLRAQFDCCAFVSVSQTPDMKKLFKGLLYDLGKGINDDTMDEKRLIDKLREFLQEKRYFIVIDDIWHVSVWKMIRCALPDNNCGYRIITTTRISDVAEQVGGVYTMKHLSLCNSRTLLYSRIFGSEVKENNDDSRKCQDEQLVEVSNKILKKCAGVPLAIITIASLLASKGRNAMEWYEVYHSIGIGLENSSDVNNMRKILSYSYYDLPSCLRTCLLYLSIFPEDYIINKAQLIRMWMAEGFIQCQKQGKSSFEVGESYFNKLINKGMIQPVDDQYSGIPECCRVHDMILDLIRTLANEENFVTILNNAGQVSPSKKIRRLSSLQNIKVEHAMHRDNMSLQQVRSVVFRSSVSLITPALMGSRVLRVLDLEYCDLSHGFDLKCLVNLFHLRYLGLRYARIAQVPEKIGDLQYLQTLDVQINKMSSLPSSVVQLRHLVCLRIDADTRVPNGIGSLTSLEELSMLCIDDNSREVIEGLGQLVELRVLDILCETEWSDSLEKSMVECLNKLQKIQSLNIWVTDGECNLDAWVAPPRLRRLELEGCWFSVLPNWMNPSLLLDLSYLRISVRELRQEDLEILGRLPGLRYLNLTMDHENLGIPGRFNIDACSFSSLVWCGLWGFGGPVVFRRGAMPRVTSLQFSFPVQEARESTGSDGGFDLGLGNLPSLQLVCIWFRSGGASEAEVKAARAALRHAIKIHPNHPSHEIRVDGRLDERSSGDNVSIDSNHQICRN